MTYAQFKQRYFNGFVDFDGAYGFQCVDLFRLYVKEVMSTPQPKGVIGAADFWTNYDSDPNLNQHFTKISNTPDGVPNQGDVVIWSKKYGPYGHIALIDNATVNGFTALSQNDPTGQPTILKQYKYTNVLGWMRPKKESMSTISIEQKVFEELVSKASKYDEFARIGYTSAAQIEQLIKDHKTEIDNKNNEIASHKRAAEEARKSLNELIVACSKALNTVQEMEQIKAALTKVDADLDALDSIQRQYAELQLHSKEQEENLRSEIAVLKALMAHSDQLAGASLKQIIREIVRRLRNYLGV